MCSINAQHSAPGADDVNVSVSDGPLQARWRRRGVEVRRAAAAFFETEDGHRDGTVSNDLALLDRPRTRHGPTVRRHHDRHPAPSSATNITMSSPSQRSQHDHHLHDPYRRHQPIHRRLEQPSLSRKLTRHHHPDPPNNPNTNTSTPTRTHMHQVAARRSETLRARRSTHESVGLRQHVRQLGYDKSVPVTSFASGPRRSSSQTLSLRPTMMSRSRSTVEYSTLPRR